MKVLNVELKMTIPNALSIFRLLLLPVFATLYLMSEKRPELLYWSFGVLVLSGVTDSLDGLIARHFNQISDLGKMLDPLADKITQVVVVICLAMRFRELIPLVVICFLKELIQGLGGIFLLKKRGGGPRSQVVRQGFHLRFLRRYGLDRAAAEHALPPAGDADRAGDRPYAVFLCPIYPLVFRH